MIGVVKISNYLSLRKKIEAIGIKIRPMSSGVFYT